MKNPLKVIRDLAGGKDKNLILEHKRHTLAHLLAAAVRDLYPGAKNTIGPAVDNGFYQDFDLPAQISEDDLAKIEKRMREMLKTWNEFEKKNVSADEARTEFGWNEYKVEMINELQEKGEQITFYTVGGFIDLCRGGHSDKPSDEIKEDSFKLERVAGAYWRGSEKNKMLTRIYGLAFNDKNELKDYIELRKEAEKRDHKKLGKELELYFFHETAPGIAYWLPKGMIVLNELTNFSRKVHKEAGYQEVSTPIVNKSDLWNISGHWEFYKNDMFVAEMGEGETYGLKAMNCPSAMIMFGQKTRSYRELPLRLFNIDVIHRYELSGVVNGLLRARAFRQDDSHNFISEDMIEDEFGRVLDIVRRLYSKFGLEYRFRFGTRPEKFMGEPADWDKAEATLEKILKEKVGKDKYFVKEGDGAFYGPKVDILMKDALGRDWQMGTIQLDFQQPKRFDLAYTDKNGEKKTPIAIHRVLYGSIERFLGILIESTAGALPVMLAPVQVSVLPITDTQKKYAKEVQDKLLDEGFRAELDDTSETLGKKIRSAKLEKVPYLLVIGEQEMRDETVMVESRDKGKIGEMSVTDFVSKLKTEI